MRYDSLPEWLHWQETLHFTEVDPGLERIGQVWHALAGSSKLPFTVITVAGTNGKGSSVAMLESILRAAGYSTGTYTSPHILSYNERICIDGQPCSDDQICNTFNKIDIARKQTSLTYFEFATLAAVELFREKNIDIAILEVGMGGRLDAVNIVDPNLAVITSIDLDHQDWLGNTKELIAIEKAEIFRANIPAVIGEPHPPSTLVDAVLEYQVKPLWQGKDFHFQINTQGFHWQSTKSRFDNLPIPNIPAQNAATALQVIETLELQLDNKLMAQVFVESSLPGRRQIVQSNPEVMLDVAHNPQATRLLANDIENMHYKRVIAVVAMLADKDINATLAPMLSIVTNWYCASLDVPRGAKASALVSAVLSSEQKVLEYDSVEIAYKSAIKKADKEDLVIVFGSFFTITNVLKMGLLPLHEKV